VEKRDATGGAVRVGMVWGGIGGAVGFVASLLGSLAGILVAGVIGVSCGRRAAEADAGRRTGALSGLLSGVVAAPVYVLGATAGAVVAARGIGSARLAAMLSEMLGTPFSSEEAWQLFLLSLILAAVFQVVVLVLASTATGAWVTRER
jgi:ABC-type dipeptide/oligopeptide/nickel transport system permease component